MLKSDDPATRGNALTVLVGDHKTERRQLWAPQVIPLLADDSWPVQSLALNLLTDLKGEEVQAALLETLQNAEKALVRNRGNEDGNVKQITEILRPLNMQFTSDREEQLVAVFLRLLDRPATRMPVLRFCARKYRNDGPCRNALLPRYRTIFAKGGNKTIVATAETGCFYGDAWFLPFLRQAASDKDEKIRQIAVWKLLEDPRFNPITEAPLLKTFAGDQSPLVRLSFINTFCDRPKGVDPTRQLKIALQMTEKDTDARVRKWACKAIFAVLKRVEPDQRRQLINVPDLDAPARMTRNLATKELRDIIVWQTSTLAAPEKMEPTVENATVWWASQK